MPVPPGGSSGQRNFWSLDLCLVPCLYASYTSSPRQRKAREYYRAFSQRSSFYLQGLDKLQGRGRKWPWAVIHLEVALGCCPPGQHSFLRLCLCTTYNQQQKCQGRSHGAYHGYLSSGSHLLWGKGQSPNYTDHTARLHEGQIATGLTLCCPSFLAPCSKFLI